MEYSNKFIALRQGSLHATVYGLDGVPCASTKDSEIFIKMRLGKQIELVDCEVNDGNVQVLEDITSKFDIHGVKSDLVIQITKKRKIGSSILGKTKIPFKDLITITDKDTKKWIPLAGKLKDARISISIRFVPEILSKLTTIQKKEFRMVFDEFDINKNGVIDKEELSQVLASQGVKVTDQQLDENIRLVDSSGTGTVEFQEFLLMMCTYEHASSDPDKYHEWRDVFKHFDKNNSGYIEVNELIDVMKELGEDITAQEAQSMLKQNDLDEDGKVSWNDFRSMMAE